MVEREFRVYLQLVKSYREGKKVRQKTLCTLGRLDKLAEENEIEHLIESLSNILMEEKNKKFVNIENLSINDAYEFGFSYTLMRLWNKTGLKDILIEELEKKEKRERAEKDLQAIFEMVLNRLAEPQSKTANGYY